jgi:hypothetical protein
MRGEASMKTCPECGHSNKDAAKFCGACGNKLEPQAPSTSLDQEPAETVCPVCGSKNRPGVHFCGYCGADLSQVAAPVSSSQAVPDSGRESTPAPVAWPAEAKPARAEAEEPQTAGPGSAQTPAPEEPAEVPSAGGSPAPEPATVMPQAGSEPKPIATCGHCGAVIRYCPCCSEPLVDADPALQAS